MANMSTIYRHQVDSANGPLSTSAVIMNVCNIAILAYSIYLLCYPLHIIDIVAGILGLLMQPLEAILDTSSFMFWSDYEVFNLVPKDKRVDVVYSNSMNAGVISSTSMSLSVAVLVATLLSTVGNPQMITTTTTNTTSTSTYASSTSQSTTTKNLSLANSSFAYCMTVYYLMKAKSQGSKGIWTYPTLLYYATIGIYPVTAYGLVAIAYFIVLFCLAPHKLILSVVLYPISLLLGLYTRICYALGLKEIVEDGPKAGIAIVSVEDVPQVSA